jgi:hypothetical protein
MKKILIYGSIIATFSASAEWKFEHIKGSVDSYSAYSFDNEYKNTLTLSCDDEYKNTIIAIFPDSKLSMKKNNIISFTFNDEEKIRFKTPYNNESTYFSDYVLNEYPQGNNKDLKDIINHLKSKKTLKIGFVNKNSKSEYFSINLSGSSKTINLFLKKCKY